MNRSTSFLDMNSPKDLKRPTNWNSFLKNSKINTTENTMKLYPAPSSTRSLKNVSCKIHTSDFWTPVMKLKLQKLSEVRLNKCEKVKTKKIPIQGSRFLDDKFKRAMENKGLSETFKLEVESSNQDSVDRQRKSNLSKNLASLDQIIEDCEGERGSNKKLCKDIFVKRKVMMDEVRRITQSIKSAR